MNRLRYKWLLLPFSILYGLVITIRNWLFNKHLLGSTQPTSYSIGVGNLTVGGTGKTPMIEFLIKRYAFGMASTRRGGVATVSRGYGRLTTGFRMATESDTAATLGDEPLQLYRKFKSAVWVGVGERRVEAIQQLLELHPETDLILLDDVFQHRAVIPHVLLLLTDYGRPFYSDFLLPIGLLREARQGARRASAVIVTKCPLTLSATDQQSIQQRIRNYTVTQTPVFFAGLQYGMPVSFATQQASNRLQKVRLVSGLANADPLEVYVRLTYQLVDHKRFADHYAYSRTDLIALVSDLPPNTALLTTEKDWVKLDSLLTQHERATWPLYYLPVAVQFLPGYETAFDEFLCEQDHKNR